MRPASRCGASEGSDWSASRSFGWTDYACASPLWETGRSSRARTEAGGQRCCENDVAECFIPRGFLNVWVCDEGGAAILDGKGEDGGCGRGDGVEGASYCQCRCGGLRSSCAACIIGSGGEERKEEEEGGGESGEAHLVSLIWEVRWFFFLLSPDFVPDKRLAGSGLFEDSRW